MMSCDCFGRAEAAKESKDALKADGPVSDCLPSQMSIPASSAAADAHKDAVGEQGATREGGSACVDPGP